MGLTQRDIDIVYLREAYRAARESDDNNTQNGAILVRANDAASLEDKNNIVARAANCFPRDIEVTEERLNGPDKLFYMGHAEENVITLALTKGINTKGLIMYCPWFACSPCARYIINAGIKEVIGHTAPEEFYRKLHQENTEKKSKWDDSIRVALEMLREAKVAYRHVEGKVGLVNILFARHNFEP